MLNRLVADRQGNVAVIFGLCLPVLGIGMGFAVDYSNGTRQQADMQNAADAAALAGARQLGLSEGEEDERETLAIATAEKYLASNKGPLEHDIVSSLDEGSVTVRVSIESPQYFGALIGRETQSISAAAKAVYMADEKAGCVIALSASAPVGIDLRGSPNLSAPKCGIWSNSESATSVASQGSGDVAANEICTVGGVSGTGRGFEPAPETGCDPSSDPYAGRLPEPPTDCDFTNHVASDGEELQPGTYCGGISVSGDDVTLDPGLYVLSGGPLTISGNGSVSGTQVSLLLTGAGVNLDLQGGSALTLTAMKTGPLTGIALAMADDGFAKTASLQGNADLNLTGSLYLPATHLTLQGTPSLTLSGLRDKLVAASFSLVGNPKIQIDADDRSDETFDLAKLRLIR